jgi:hypothetical protein
MQVQGEEFKFPDETKADAVKEEPVDFEVEGDETPDIEVVDDTPEQDRGRKPLDREVEDPTDDELQEYGEKVKNRIKELTHARHDERRAREAAQREKDEAFRLAQAAVEENKRLKKQLTQGQNTYVSQAQKLAEVEVERAKSALKAAHEAGDTEAFVEAQTLLNQAVFMLEHAKSMKAPPLQEESDSGNVPAQQAVQPPVPKVDHKAQAWKQRNSWFGEDDEMTSFALGLHNKLVKQGYDTSSDDYYKAIDNRVRQVFPDKFESEKTEQKSASPARKPATVVAPSSRATSAKKIVLTQTQVSLAKRLGLPLEVYAKQVAEEMRKQNG